MTIFKVGNLEDFFSSVTETAREIDKGEKVTPKHTIWIDPQDLTSLLQPTFKFIRKHKRVYFSELSQALHRSHRCLNKDLSVLLKYELIHIHNELNSKHRKERVIESTLHNEQIELRIIM